MVKLILYTRPECHLCDEAKATLRQLAHEATFVIEERDVDDRAVWAAAFGNDVPVGVIDDRKVFKHRLDPPRLLAALRARGA